MDKEDVAGDSLIPDGYLSIAIASVRVMDSGLWEQQMGMVPATQNPTGFAIICIGFEFF
jgi:hypothetical protein